MARTRHLLWALAAVLLGALMAAGSAHAATRSKVRSGRPLTAPSKPATPAAKDPLEAARAPAAQLEPQATTSSLGVTFHRYRQALDGIPVLGAETVVTDAPGKRADLVLDRSRAGLTRPASPRVPKAQAVAVAQTAAGSPRVERAVASLAILPGGAGTLVWRVVVVSRDPIAESEVLVDAQTRAVLRKRSLLDSATGQASIFDPNPVKEQRSFAGLTDSGDSNVGVPGPLYLPRTLTDVVQGGCPAGTVQTNGPWVQATFPQPLANETTPTDGGGPETDVLPCSDTSQRFTGIFRQDTATSAAFEALMAYFHIDRAQRYIQALGFTNVNHRQIRARVNAEAGDNSHYQPTTKTLSFGVGGVDDAEDADVILHEYGHSIQDNQVPGFGVGVEGNAMGEGFGDYFASSVNDRFSPSGAFAPCWAAWDNVGLRGYDCERRTDSTSATNQQARVCGSPDSYHCYGRAWSGALWAIRGQLGATKADTLVLQSHFSQPADAGFYDAAQSLLVADRQLYGGADVPFLSALLGQRNLLREPDNTPPNAESLGVPGTAVDYADASPTYSDTDDIYAVTLQAGQTVTARLAAGAGNLDLFLYQPGTTSVATTAGVVARSESPVGAERLVYIAPIAGRYLLDVFAKSGVSTYTLSTVNGDDAAPPPPPLPPRDTTAPTVRSYTIAPTRFRATRRAASVAAKTGASVRYRLSEPATVRFRVLRPLPGRRIRGTCKRATRSNRKRGRRCTVFKALPGSFSHASAAGSNRIRFTGRLRKRALPRRKYVLSAGATDAAANRSKAARVRFQIVR